MYKCMYMFMNIYNVTLDIHFDMLQKGSTCSVLLWG